MERSELLQLRYEQLTVGNRHLEAGTYHFDPTLRLLYREDQANDPLVRKMIDDRNDETIAPFVVEKPKEDEEGFKGQMLWFGINGDLKFFAEEQVLTVTASSESYQNRLSNYHMFQPFFPQPELRANEELVPGIYLEERIKGRMPVFSDWPVVKDQLQADYQRYFKACAEGRQFGRMPLELQLQLSANSRYQEEFQEVIDQIPPILWQLGMPRIHVHGDLWSENLLLTDDPEGRLTYLDWTDGAVHFFPYDFFKFLWNELDVHGEAGYLEDYLAGGADEMLDSWFAIFGEEFDKEYRLGYLHQFFVDFLLQVDEQYPYENKRVELAAYKEKVLGQGWLISGGGN